MTVKNEHSQLTTLPWRKEMVWRPGTPPIRHIEHQRYAVMNFSDGTLAGAVMMQ